MTIMELGINFKRIFGFNPPIDMIHTAAIGPTNAKIDVIKLDKMFSERDADYDNEECTFKGRENYSMSKYVEERWGAEASDFIRNNL